MRNVKEKKNKKKYRRRNETERSTQIKCHNKKSHTKWLLANINGWYGIFLFLFSNPSTFRISSIYLFFHFSIFHHYFDCITLISYYCKLIKNKNEDQNQFNFFYWLFHWQLFFSQYHSWKRYILILSGILRLLFPLFSTETLDSLFVDGRSTSNSSSFEFTSFLTKSIFHSKIDNPDGWRIFDKLKCFWLMFWPIFEFEIANIKKIP